jgi:hypothetical protein
MLTRRGGRLSLVIDQQAVLDNLPVDPAAPAGARLVLRPQEGAAEFASIFVKQLN